jgi:hypothetical protein
MGPRAEGRRMALSPAPSLPSASSSQSTAPCSRGRSAHGRSPRLAGPVTALELGVGEVVRRQSPQNARLGVAAERTPISLSSESRPCQGSASNGPNSRRAHCGQNRTTSCSFSSSADRAPGCACQPAASPSLSVPHYAQRMIDPCCLTSLGPTVRPNTRGPAPASMRARRPDDDSH